MKLISRRTAVTGILSGTALLAWTASFPTNPDVVIVGAGAAGIAAARTLIRSGKSVIIVEAADRAGGRAHTDETIFGVPFDHGCSWITGGSDLPLIDIAIENNFTLLDHLGAGDYIFNGNQRLTREELDVNNSARTSIMRDLAVAGQARQDVSASSVIDTEREFSGFWQTWIGPMDYGVDFSDLSTLDYWNANDADVSYLVKEGLGNLIKGLADALPVQLNSRVTAIDWSGDGVKVTTSDGTIKAKTCIVTVSTGVLASGSIRFTPALPDTKQAAINNVPMGLLQKTALAFDGTRFGLRPNEWLSYRVPNKMPAEAMYFLIYPFNFDMMIGFFGGAFAWELSAEGEAAAIDFALGELEKMLGSDVRKHFVRGQMTGWDSNPYTLGSYGAARPGHHFDRYEIAKPLGERVFFAGEAMALPYAALCGGAYLNGIKIADQVRKVLQ